MQPGKTLPVRADSARNENADAQPKLPDATSPCAEVVALTQQLQQTIGTRRFSVWFEHKVRFEIVDTTLVVWTGSPFLLGFMSKEFRQILKDLATGLLGPASEVRFDVDGSLAQIGQPLSKPGLPSTPLDGLALLQAATLTNGVAAPVTSKTVADRESSSANSARPAAPLPGSRARRYADLADFVVSPGTELAAGTCQKLAKGEPVPFQTLYLHGPVGVGKSHLLEGVYRQLRQSRPEANVLLLTAETFANYFTQALREKTLPGFRHKFRSLDVLLVDDANFFDSTKVIREEFLHTFRELIDHGRQIIIAADRHPRLLTRLGDELITRFLAGAVCRLESPDLATRKRIVEAKAKKLAADFAPETLNYVATRFQANVRELEGALNCLETYHAVTGKRVTLAAARQVLSDLEHDCLRVIRLADVEKAVCELFGLGAKELKSPSRSKMIAKPRMLAMFLARKHTSCAYSEIGLHFGGRNHSTVMSAEKKISESIATGEKWRVGTHDWNLEEVIGSLEQQLLAT